MYIVPSGTRRLMKFQQAEVSPNSTPKPRTGIEQEEVGGMGLTPPQQPSQSGGGFNPLGQLGNTLDQQGQNSQQTATPNAGNADSNPSQDVNLEGNPSDGKESEGIEDGSKIANDIRTAWYKIMEGLGVPPRLFRNSQHADKFFHIDEEVIGKGEAHGFFVLPSKTQSKQIPKEEAVAIAKKLGSQFGITNMNFSYAVGDNYKFTFKVLVQDNSNMSGSSLDSMISGGSSSKSASSKNSFIKQSHNSIIDSLIKQGFGVKNAS